MNKNNANIILSGFMGSGKTAVGRALAELMKRKFIDMDAEIIQREGRSISRIFSEDGEPHFRQIERRLVQELAGRTGHIIATGGGVVLNPLNIDDFTRAGFMVCLQASAKTIYERIKHDTTRPLLQGDGDKIDRINQILEARKPIYASIPFQLKVDDKSVDQVATAIHNSFLAWAEKKHLR